MFKQPAQGKGKNRGSKGSEFTSSAPATIFSRQKNQIARFLSYFLMRNSIGSYHIFLSKPQLMRNSKPEERKAAKSIYRLRGVRSDRAKQRTWVRRYEPRKVTRRVWERVKMRVTKRDGVVRVVALIARQEWERGKKGRAVHRVRDGRERDREIIWLKRERSGWGREREN
jgi:hypothetical protein